jgi:hypothetical protein
MVAELTSVADIDVDHDGHTVLDGQDIMGTELDTDAATLAPLEIDLDHGRGLLLFFFLHEKLLLKPPVGCRGCAEPGLR